MGTILITGSVMRMDGVRRQEFLKVILTDLYVVKTIVGTNIILGDTNIIIAFIVKVIMRKGHNEELCILDWHCLAHSCCHTATEYAFLILRVPELSG